MFNYRSVFAENVTHMTARQNQQSSATHPNSEGHFNVLRAPNVHAFVVRADFVEIIAVYREQAACHCGSSKLEKFAISQKKNTNQQKIRNELTKIKPAK